MKKKSLFTTHPTNDRERKNLLFLSLIRKHKSISRTEIGKIGDINVVTVSNYINGYLKKGLILEGGYDISSGGRRPELIELNKNGGYVLGIDVGRGYIKGILVNLNMEVLASVAISDYEIQNLKFYIGEIFKKVIECSKIDTDRVKKIGIGVSHVPDSMEYVLRVKDEIESELRIPILVGDAALCASSGEKSLNPEVTEASTILYVYRDIGQGVFIKDDEFYQAHPAEGKYVYLRPWGEKLSIASEAKRLIEKGIGTKIVAKASGNLENITIETIIEAAEEQDEIACDLLRMAGMNLSVRIAYLVNLFEPEAVIVGGGIEKSKDRFLKPLASNINKFISQRLLDRVRLTPALLAEEACVKGSSSLAIREVFIEA